MRWDPAQYGRFAEQRRRPFIDLTQRIAASAPRRVVDLGCGDGALTGLLARRWPQARVEGVDSSRDMIAAAGSRQPGVSFHLADVRSWSMPDDVDVIISNAMLQWVPEHRELLTRWATAVPVDGWLAFQVPGNDAAPSHVLPRTLATSPAWADALAGVLDRGGEERGAGDAIGDATQYASLLLNAGLVVDAWETTYVHVLPGADAVLQWLRGTTLRPVMAALSPDVYARFEAELAPHLRAAYPRGEQGTLLPFRRVFAVAHRL